MKAVAKCLKCEKVINTDCRGCIESGSSLHICNSREQLVDVKWKRYPEDERELGELENEC